MPMCSCCSDEKVVEMALEVLRHVAENYYGKKDGGICCGSMSDVLNIAAIFGNHISSQAHLVQSIKDDENPIEAAVMAAMYQRERQDAATKCVIQHDDRMSLLDRMRNIMNTIAEIQEADELFDKKQKRD